MSCFHQGFHQDFARNSMCVGSKVGIRSCVPVEISEVHLCNGEDSYSIYSLRFPEYTFGYELFSREKIEELVERLAG